MANSFLLHPRLHQDCISIGSFELCRLLLMNDQNYPWFILVPMVAEIREIYQLSKTERDLLSDESCYLSENLARLFDADKLNIAAIGNIVPQLHIHHIVRYQTDLAWPSPVWGFTPTSSYNNQQILAIITKLRSGLTACRFDSSNNN